jgi:hypothetical protein
MAGIPVSVGPATAEGRLYPRYDNRAGILSLDTRALRACPIGIRIDSLILDFDEDGRLAGAELLLPMTRWKGKADTSGPAGGAQDIMLRELNAGTLEHDWPLTVSFDVQSDSGRVDFGSGGYDRSVALSAGCQALLLGDDLTGFWFSLAR